MLTKFKVENFKSIHSLELELGRVNVFIGENGSGKSNVLEAVALASAAAADRLDHEFLAPRGIRVTAPELMRSGFDRGAATNPIDLVVEIDGVRRVDIQVQNDNQPYSKWIWNAFRVMDPDLEESMVESFSALIKSDEAVKKDLRKSVLESVRAMILERKYANPPDSDSAKWFIDYEFSFGKKILGPYMDFLIYSPEHRSLRTFADSEQIQPVGVIGQGLFRLLQHFASEPNQPAIRELNHHLQLFGWFESFALPERLWPGESFLKIKDRFLHENIDFIDQRSANEGFLFVLFYLSLFISKDTPKFFAIDNIENALNPMLCTKLMTTLAELSKKHDKQVMITTHSPAALDGINLNDEEQRLFVVYRNAHGHTVARRVRKPQPLPGQEPAKLSQLFMWGHLGGMPDNFSL